MRNQSQDAESNNYSPVLSRRTFLVLGGTAIAAGGAYWWAAWHPVYAGGSLSVTEAHTQAANGTIILIDIRRPDEWSRTGIGKGAHPIDMRRDDFNMALAEITGDDRTVPIALICARGVRSARLSKRLTEAGYRNIIDVPEGMEGSKAGPGWVASNLPTYEFTEISK
ncbi:MAG: rhodanese-like domain-containing protein [Rhodobacteraceae bacterium]|nr:rhodanese-like domain-containing protein [Paracoccaceae bacterium]